MKNEKSCNFKVKNKGLQRILCGILFASVFILFCSSFTEKAFADGNASAREPFLNVGRLTMNPGDRSKIIAVNATKEIGWSSEDKKIARVDKNGTVRAIAEGETSVYATIGDKKLECRVTVVPTVSISLCAVGDALLHENILKSGLQDDGTYNYDRLFTHMKRTLKDYDVKIINEETILVEDSSKYAGYPSFGSPLALGDAIRKAGFNVVTCATNHAYDRGITGIKDTVRYWKNYKDDVLMTGIYTNQEEYDKIPIKEFDGIKIAFLNYTALVNSGSKRESYNIRFLNEKQVIKDIKSAKKKADFVVVLPHWGEEYEHQPTTSVVSLSKRLAEAGADLIIGCHPHVVQPMKILKTSDGRKVPCFYSLGNYFSNMFWFKCQLEGMADVTITKTTSGTKVTACDYIPIVNHISTKDDSFSVYLLEDYTESVAKKHYMNYRTWMGIVTPLRLKNLFDSLGNDKWK